MLVLRALKAASARPPVSASASSPQSQSTLFHGLALKINYTAEVREKTKANPSASGQVDSPTAQRVNALTTASITGTAITQTQGQGASCLSWPQSSSMATPVAPLSLWLALGPPFPLLSYSLEQQQVRLTHCHSAEKANTGLLQGSRRLTACYQPWPTTDDS